MKDYKQIALNSGIIISNYTDEFGDSYIEVYGHGYKFRYAYPIVSDEELGMFAVFYDRLKENGFIK